MKKNLTLSPDLSLPAADAATRSYGILGMKGSGKSNAAVVLAEEFSSVGIPWVAIDPKGDWHGVRSAANGKDPGLKVVIFGGQHADVPLEPTAAAGCVLADLILDERLTALLDISEFSNKETIEFLAGVGNREGFADRFYRRKPTIPGIWHMFLEEAHELCPQQPDEGRQKLVNRVSKFQTMGRQRGLGCSVLSQRSARVHKDILTQSDVLVVFRTMGPQDVDAIGQWLKYHGQNKEILASLSSLKDGEGWVWSPEWLGETVRTQFRRRWTFDSGATPTFGEHAVAEPVRAEIDLAKISERMAETIERAKADDPRELRNRIKSIERGVQSLVGAARFETTDFDPFDPEDMAAFAEFLEIQSGNADVGGVEVDRLTQRLEEADRQIIELRDKPVEIPMITPEDLERYEDGVKRIAEACESVNAVAQSIHARIYALKSPQPVVPVLDRVLHKKTPSVGHSAEFSAGVARGDGAGHVLMNSASKRGFKDPGATSLRLGARRMLAAIAAFPGTGLNHGQIGMLADLAKSGTYDAYMSDLKRAGLVTTKGDNVVVTPAGLKHAATLDVDMPETTEALLGMWKKKLRSGARRMFDIIVESGARGIDKPRLSEKSKLAVSGTFDAYFSDIRRTGCFEYEDSMIRVRDDLSSLCGGR